MTSKLIRLDMADPPPTRLHCPFTGRLVISAADPLEIESRLDNLSPYLRFVLFYERTSYPVFWAANPDALDEEQRGFQEDVIRHWTTAADVGQATATWDGSWYNEYLQKVEGILPPSSLLLEINTYYQSDIPESVLNDPNMHISWDFSPGYTTAACFIADQPKQDLKFKRVKTMWDTFLTDYAPGKS